MHLKNIIMELKNKKLIKFIEEKGENLGLKFSH